MTASVERYFSADARAAFEPVCRRIADELASRTAGEVDLIEAVAEEFALRVQCASKG